MTKKLFLGLILLATLTTISTGCGAPQPLVKSPLPSPTAGALVSPLVPTIKPIIPTPASSKATITGVMLQNAGAPSPVSGAILYLARLVPDASGKPFLASIDKTSSPRTQTDSAGRFIFADVPPDTYSLVLDKITSSYLLKDPKTGGDLLFEPKAGQVLDVGQLIFSSLPGEGSAP